MKFEYAFWFFVCLIICGTLLLANMFADSKTNTVPYAVFYKDCTVLERNHYNGTPFPNTDKLECNGVIYNLETNKYDGEMKIH